ncbi:hypothetical protein EXIGLDRAFT_465087 [Exidia glandulosa HHB12029]|uniref:Uncharacterized protein n=1 Tax=Exidia glandulosa HHB12029 TaxID=1314781 RepID=A0A165K232_EXIGL|nr:hypothetical protein EXIGLDRAFT_465087 [Exidia glandulosa HHB12029]
MRTWASYLLLVSNAIAIPQRLHRCYFSCLGLRFHTRQPHSIAINPYTGNGGPILAIPCTGFAVSDSVCTRYAPKVPQLLVRHDSAAAADMFFKTVKERLEHPHARPLSSVHRAPNPNYAAREAFLPALHFLGGLDRRDAYSFLGSYERTRHRGAGGTYSSVRRFSITRIRRGSAGHTFH